MRLAGEQFIPQVLEILFLPAVQFLEDVLGSQVFAVLYLFQPCLLLLAAALDVRPPMNTLAEIARARKSLAALAAMSAERSE